MGIFFLLLGTIIGSFLNVVILRYGKDSLDGRSHCVDCDKQLKWYELIPILSFVFLRGKCGKCGKKISIQYPLVEIGTGLVFLGIYLKIENILEVLFISLLFSLLIFIIVYDLYHKVIPDFFSYSFGVLALLYNFIFLPLDYVTIITGPILFLPFWFLWFISKGRWIGLGDGKLALGIGWFLGMTGGISAVLLAFWIGAAVSILLLVISRISQLSAWKKRLTMKTEVPFAPFLIIGFWLVFFFDVNVLFI